MELLKALSSKNIFTGTLQELYTRNISVNKPEKEELGMDTLLITCNSSIQLDDKWRSRRNRVLVVCVNCSTSGFFLRSHFDNVFVVTLTTQSKSYSFFDAKMWNRPDEELPMGTCVNATFTRHHRSYENFRVWSRGALRGVTLRIATAADPPARVWDQFNHRNGIITGGLAGELLLTLQDCLGFDYELIPVLSSQPWDAMAALVAAGGADVASVLLMATADRQGVLRFSQPAQQVRVGVALRRPRLRADSGQVLRPFTNTAWIGVAVLLALLSVSLLLARRLERLADGQTGADSALDVAFAMIGLVCQQGTELELRRAAARMVLLSGLLGTFVLHVTYSAVLLSFLAVHVPELPFDSLEELRAADGWRYSALNSALRERSPMPGPEPDTLADGYKESVLRFREDERVAVAVTADTLAYSMGCRGENTSTCPFCVMPQQTSKTYRSLAFRRDFPHYQLFNELVMRLKASGSIQRLEAAAQRNGLKEFMCPGPDDVIDPVQQSIGISDLYQCFAMLAVGIILSVAVLVIERTVKDKTNSILPI